MRRKVRYVAGVKFVCRQPGHWYSECGQFAIFHMMEGTRSEQWELYRRRGDDDLDYFIDRNFTLGELVTQVENDGGLGSFRLEPDVAQT